ncbi:MAG: class II aldolase/adducin family protein [Fimbriimonadales bacterium]
MAEFTEKDLREQICGIGRALYERDLVGGAEGNLTVRLPDGNILATPAGAVKGWLHPDHLAIVKPDGEQVGDARASSEIELHLRIYKERADVMAVIHAHPIAATSFSAAGKPVPQGVLVEVDLILGEVPLVPFAMPGTPELGDVIAPFLEGRKAFLLQAHGAVTVADDLRTAFVWMETLERCCRILLQAAAIGGAKPVPPEMVRWLEEF